MIKIIPLVVLSVLTSATIVVDASEWYGALYDDLDFFDWFLSGKLRGIVFALILEMFLAVMMAVRLPDLEGDHWWGRYHPGNWAMSFVAVFCFITILFGTWQGIIEGKEARFTITGSVQAQIDATREALDRNGIEQERFEKMEQPGNLALAGIEGRRLAAKLEELLARTEDTTDMGKVQLWFLAIAKFVMLSANMISLWLVGRVARGWREEKQSVAVLDDSPFPQDPEPSPATVRIEDEIDFSDMEMEWDVEVVADVASDRDGFGDHTPDNYVDMVIQPEWATREHRYWTKADFLDAFRDLKMTSREILEGTGLTEKQLTVIVYHTSKVLKLISKGFRVRRQHEEDGQTGPEEDGPDVVG